MPENVPIAAADPAVGHWFTDDRVLRIGQICADLLLEPSHWIDRRKDSVTILDDTALRWQNSVDFELPTTVGPLERSRPETGQALYCAPLFVLPKKPSHYMAFDLVDESGRSLSLTSRVENARISAAILKAMAEKLVTGTLATSVAQEIDEIALCEDLEGKRRARRLLMPISGDVAHPQWSELAQHRRFGWWLKSVADSSIVVVPYRGSPGQRKGIKLSYEVQFEVEVDLQVLLGWKPYGVVLDQPFVEARSYHFEAKAPTGLRVHRASLSDDREGVDTTYGGGLKRRVHLYRRQSHAAGAAVGTLALRVSSDGFLTGAWLSAALVTAALLICDLSAEAIARNPTSAPALLLILPGLLASYVGRPDRHAMTSRLLSAARNLVLLCAVAAYTAGVVVALTGKSTDDDDVVAERVGHLHAWLTGATALTAVLCVLLAVSWGCSHPWVRLRFRRSEWRRMRQRISARQFAVAEVVLLSPAELVSALYGEAESPVQGRQGDEELAEEYAALKPILSPHLKIVRRTTPFGSWIFYVYAADDPGGASGKVRGVFRARWWLRPVSGLFVVREKDRVAGRLDKLATSQAP
jgi:hypothetical protein